MIDRFTHSSTAGWDDYSDKAAAAANKWLDALSLVGVQLIGKPHMAIVSDRLRWQDHMLFFAVQGRKFGVAFSAMTQDKKIDYLEIVRTCLRFDFAEIEAKRIATSVHATVLLGIGNEGAGRIAQLVESAGYELKFWSDRFGRGIWITLLPGVSQGEIVRDLCEQRGESGFDATDNTLGCAWLPIALGNTLQNANEELEKKLIAISLEQLQRGSTWSAATHAAIELMTDGTFRALPHDYEVIAAAAKTRGIVGGELTW